VNDRTLITLEFDKVLARLAGLTATAPGFFGAQGRPIPSLPVRFPDLADDMMRQRVMNFEMEASALLVLVSACSSPALEPESARSVPSSDPANTSDPSGEKATDVTRVVNGDRLLIHAHLSTSQNHTAPSMHSKSLVETEHKPVASRLPSGDISMLVTCPAW